MNDPGTPRPSRLLFALGLAALTYSLSQTMLVPALPQIERELDATPAGVTVLMSSFWVSGAVTAGIFGRLGDMFGKRLMILIQLLLFTIGALICAVSPSLPLMVVGRVVMGVAVGIFALSFALIRDELPPKRVAGMIAVLAGLISTGAALGQATGGIVSDAFGFRALFWFAAGMGLLTLIIILVLVPESPERPGGRVDVVGAILLAGGIALPLAAVTETPRWGWLDLRTLLFLAAGGALLAAFARFERRQREPLIDIDTLMLPRIRLTNAATLFVGFGFFGFSTILTQFFQEPTSTGYGSGASSTQAGLYLVPGMALLAIMSALSGRLSGYWGPVVTFRLGTIVCTIGGIGMTLAHSHTFELYLWPAVLYTGAGLTFGTMPTIILQSVSPEQSGQSSAINQILRVTGSAIGVQIAATLVTSSIGPSGNPSEAGYVAAFGMITGAGVIALVLALAIPRRLGTAATAPLLEPVALSQGPPA